MAAAGAEAILAEDYVPVGIDHFAKPADGMAQKLSDGTLRRNFQGYTTDDADALIGFGASSIGRLRQGYVQNITPTGQYCRAISDGHLPVARGFALSESDRAAACAIEDLMCRYAFSVTDLRSRFGRAADGVCADAMRTYIFNEDELTTFDGNTFAVTPKGRPFVRAIAAKFDRYLKQGHAKHSVAV